MRGWRRPVHDRGIDLLTPRLRVRRYRADDLEAYLGFHHHPDVAVTMGQPPMPVDAARDYLATQAVLEEAAVGVWHGYAIEERGGVDTLVGEVGLYLQVEPAGEADLGFALHPAAQGRGLATEAARLLLDHAFADLGLRRVTGHCDAANPASARVLERVGLSLVDESDGRLAYALDRIEGALRSG